MEKKEHAHSTRHLVTNKNRCCLIVIVVIIAVWQTISTT